MTLFLYLSCTNKDSAIVVNCLRFVTVATRLKNSELYMRRESVINNVLCLNMSIVSSLFHHLFTGHDGQDK